MKILAISCSPRQAGGTATLLREVLKGAKEDGAGVEFYSVAGKDIKPCDGCHACVKTGKCHIKDDMQELYDKMVAADGIIFGTPVYFYGMAAQAKTILDRTDVFAQTGALANKVGGIVAVAGSLGLSTAIKDFCFYFVTRRMLIANYLGAYGLNAYDFKQMEKCMQAAHDLGRTVAALVKMNFKYPIELMGRAIAYGTHTK
jgi:multimeric flavodoxin WrbA